MIGSSVTSRERQVSSPQINNQSTLPRWMRLTPTGVVCFFLLKKLIKKVHF